MILLSSVSISIVQLQPSGGAALDLQVDSPCRCVYFRCLAPACFLLRVCCQITSTTRTFYSETKSKQVCLQNHIWVRTGCRQSYRLQEFSIGTCGVNPAVITAGVCLNRRPGCLDAEREAQQQKVGGPKVSVQEVGPFLLNKTHQSQPKQSETLMLETVTQLCSRIVSENSIHFILSCNSDR